MPLIHERIFRVRYYECDAYGHVNNANYLRYMQEATFDASAAAGYDLARYEALGCLWLVRETDIEYLRPLRYGDSVRVKTWVADYRRVRFRRMHELYHAASGELAARASTDWIYVNSATGKPAPVPQDMIAAFFPEGAPPPASPPDPFPEPPPSPPGIFKMRRRVLWPEIDGVRHVNNANYLLYVEDCGFQVGDHFGWPSQRMWEAGFAILPRRHRIEYRQSAVFGDEVEVATWAYDIRRATGTRHYLVTRASDSAVLARVNSLYVWVDRETLRPIRVPPVILADFAPNIVDVAQLGQA